MISNSVGYHFRGSFYFKNTIKKKTILTVFIPKHLVFKVSNRKETHFRTWVYAIRFKKNRRIFSSTVSGMIYKHVVDIVGNNSFKE